MTTAAERSDRTTRLCATGFHQWGFVRIVTEHWQDGKTWQRENYYQGCVYGLCELPLNEVKQ